MSYRYETHLHTFPVSHCGKFGVRENLEFYSALGYDGVFITNHFIDGPSDRRYTPSHEANIEFFCSDYEAGKEIGRELGLRVFFGMETTFKGTDFLVYGLDGAWYLAHPELTEMQKRDQLAFLIENGALVIQAHPFREAKYIDHIRLFPRSVHGVEVINACRTDFENEMAAQYAKNYGLLPFAGSDNHHGPQRPQLAGMQFETQLCDERDFVERILRGEGELFHIDNPLVENQD